MFGVLKGLMAQFVKPDHLEKATTAKYILKVPYSNRASQLDNSKLAIGQDTRAAMMEKSIKDADKSKLYMSFRLLFAKATEKLIHYLPLTNELEKDLLFSWSEAHYQSGVLSAVKGVADKLKHIDKDINVYNVQSEWTMYVLEPLSEKDNMMTITDYWLPVVDIKTYIGIQLCREW